MAPTNASSGLTISPNPTTAAQKPKLKKKAVADSWEDEELSSDDEDTPAIPPPKSESSGTTAPLSTPISPSYHSQYGTAPPSSPGVAPARRPEKTDAVARRMIAGALGVRLPRQTEEQRAYEKSLREAEKKRRDDERAARKREEEEKEKAKRAVWED